MRVFIRGKRRHGKGHLMHVMTHQKPSWIEWLFLFKRKGFYDYVGKGTMWRRIRTANVGKRKVFVEDAEPIKSKSLIKILRNEHP